MDASQRRPGAYREVSVADVDVPLTGRRLIEHFRGRECYRRTRYIVARHGGAHALVEVERGRHRAAVLAGGRRRGAGAPEETVYVAAPEVDTGVPSQLASIAVEHPRRAASWSRAATTT